MKKAARERAHAALAAAKSALSGIEHDSSAFSKALALLVACRGTIIVSGVGKSAAIATKAAATLTSLGHPSIFLDPVAALHGDSGIIRASGALITISFSGETKELLRMAAHMKKIGKLPMIAITGRMQSPLAVLADATLIIPAKKEGSPHELAPMASTTASLVLCDMLAAALTDPKKFDRHAFARIHPGGSLGLSLTAVSAMMRPLEKTPRILATVTFGEALSVMTEGGLGVTALVSPKGMLEGVLTDGDVRRILLAHDAPKRMRVGALMMKRPKSVKRSATLKEAVAEMEKYKITALFVTERGRLAGIIHLHDIVERGL